MPADGAAPAPTGEAAVAEGTGGEAPPSEPTATLPAGEAAVATVASAIVPTPAPAASLPSTPAIEATPTTTAPEPDPAPAPAQSATEPIAEDQAPIVSMPPVEVPIEGEGASSTPTPVPVKSESTAEAPTSPTPLPTRSREVHAEAPTASAAAPTGQKRNDVPTETAAQGSSDERPPAGQERSPEAPTPRAPVVTAPTVATPAQPSAPSSPTANGAFSSPAPTAPAPAPSAALEATLRMAGANGFTRARVTLRPAELGGVEVFLREGSAGLTATVVADTPHAAQLLQSSANELQRRLAAQGLELSSLQISVGGESAGAAHGGRDQQGGPGTPGGARDGATEALATAEETQTIDLGGGVLVDVLA